MIQAVLLFGLFLALSAFFSSSETAFVSVDPCRLEYLEKKGSRRARLIRQVLGRLNELLVTILVGNTLVNVAAAAVATSIFVRLIPGTNRAILLATVTTTLFLLVFGEINPKTFAAHNSLKTAFVFIHPLRLLMILFYPVIKVFTFLTGLLQPGGRRPGDLVPQLEEEEIRIFLSTRTRGLSAVRRKMIAGVLDIGRRPVKEIMVPRPGVKAIEIGADLGQVLEIIRSSGFSRYPVYRGRVDNVEGLIHAKDVIPFLAGGGPFDLKPLLRRPLFIPELASLEKALLQMQEAAVHQAFVIDEFGNMEGIVTMEDIIEEIVGEIQDEYDPALEAWLTELGGREYLVKGAAPVKAVNDRLGLNLPEKADYTTLAGFFLYEVGRIPREKESLEFRGDGYIVEKMTKRHISLLRIRLKETGSGGEAA